MYDHASTGVQAPWGIPDDVVHLDAVALWIGGLAVLAGFALRGAGPAASRWPGRCRGSPRSRSAASPPSWRAAPTRPGGRSARGARWSAPSYGRLILAKLSGLVLLIVLGYLARRFIQRGLSPAVRARGGRAGGPDAATAAAGGPAAAVGTMTATGTLMLADTAANSVLVDGPAGPGEPPGSRHRRRLVPSSRWDPSMRRLRRSVAAELGIATVILALTAVLVNTATGREAYAPTVSASQAFSTGGPGGAGIVHVFAEPARLGPNTIEVYFTTADGGRVPAGPGDRGAVLPGQEPRARCRSR